MSSYNGNLHGSHGGRQVCLAQHRPLGSSNPLYKMCTQFWWHPISRTRNFPSRSEVIASCVITPFLPMTNRLHLVLTTSTPTSLSAFVHSILTSSAPCFTDFTPIFIHFGLLFLGWIESLHHLWVLSRTRNRAYRHSYFNESAIRNFLWPSFAYVTFIFVHPVYLNLSYHLLPPNAP